MKRFPMSDLLIEPDGVRFVVTDKGSTWVTDRFVMVRGDLFKRIPGDRLGGYDKPLPVSAVRSILSRVRGPGKALMSTEVEYVGPSGVPASGWRAGAALLFLNQRVTRTYFDADLRPRYIASQDTVVWYGTKRGRDVLMVVHKPVMPWDLRCDNLRGVAS